MDKPYVVYAWGAFFLFIGAVILWFTASAGYQLYQYAVLQEKTFAKKIEWSVVEVTDEKYVLNAQYTFDLDGTSFSGNTRMTSLSFRNQWAAEQSIPKYDKQQWEVWYSPGNPHHSTLQKNFPLKECLSAALLWGIMGYFLWLQYYLKLNDGKKNS